MKKTVTILSFVGLLCCLDATWGSDCPFPNNPPKCSCMSSGAGAHYDFETILCESAGLPNLTVPGGTTFKVKLFLVGSTDIAKIPDRYFASFASIDYLILSLYSDQGYVKQSFAPGAFDGTKIMNISFSGIDGLIPPPDQLTKLGKAGLQMLGIIRHGPMALDRPHFAGFRKLSGLFIWQSQIIEIDDVIFNGVSLSLQDLSFSNVGWTDFPTGLLAISNVMRLASLDLSKNRIASIPKDALTKNLFLSRIDLSGNPLKQQIESQAFEFPSFTKELALKNIGFESVPNSLWRNPLLQMLDLSQNAIKKLQRGDFMLAQVYLDSNPIETIDPNAFDPSFLSYLNLVSLSDTKLQKLDLALFTALGDNMTQLILNDNPKLSLIWLSQQGRVPANLKISARNTSLSVIDQSCSYLFQTSTKVKMDISNSQYLDCNNLSWMAPYVLTTQQITADDAFCAPGLSLKDYLNGLPDQTTGAAPSSSSSSRSSAKPRTTPSGRDATTAPSSGLKIGTVSLLITTLVFGTTIRTFLDF